ncbi:MAG: hypothetical protein AAGI53_13790 [Planctomycetota bacterium]
MPLFRVFGLRDEDTESSVLIECASEAVARNAAVREGFINTTRVELVEGDVDEDPVRPVRLNPMSPSKPDLTKFDRRPVWVIAQGVFWGLMLWAGFTLTVYLLLLGLDSVFGTFGR